MENPTIVETPTYERLESFRIRFVPGRGLFAEAFPLRIAISPDMLYLASTHPGVIEVHGDGGIGTTVEFTLQNGCVIYELVARALAETVQILIAERRAFKPLVSGKDFVIKRYNLTNLADLADEWPALACFYSDVLHPPVHLQQHIRVRNRTTQPELVLRFNSEKAVYTITGSFQDDNSRVLYVAERFKLFTPRATTIRVPAAVTATRGNFKIYH